MNIFVRRRFCIIIIFCTLTSFLFLSGCLQKRSRRVSEKYNSVSSLEHLKLQEAWLDDVPVPISAKMQSKESESVGGHILSYKISQSINDIAQFYVQEMERYGWQQQETIQSDERFFCFKKPSSTCYVSLRPLKLTKKAPVGTLLVLVVTRS